MPTWVQRSKHGLGAPMVLALLLLGAGGCATTPQSRPADRTEPRAVPGARHRLEAAGIRRTRAMEASPASLDALYNAAVANSAVFRAEHQVSDLWPVNGVTQMGSLMSCDCPGDNCSAYCGLQSGQPAPTDIWVSPAAQVLQFCQSFPKTLTADQVILKLQQLQGLPPQTGQDPCTWQILQVTIDNPQVPEQFFRPCPDPDPTTKGPCPADFPTSYSFCSSCSDSSEADLLFRAWMAGQAFSAWQIPDGYPWTHLGYTYNWDPEAPTIVGTSEYVIPQCTPVQVVGQVPAIEFCTNKRLTCP